jgi:hypothetical protein
MAHMEMLKKNVTGLRGEQFYPILGKEKRKPPSNLSHLKQFAESARYHQKQRIGVVNGESAQRSRRFTKPIIDLKPG